MAPWMQSSLAYVGMTTGIVGLAVSQIISKLAMSAGASFYILILYSNAAAALVLFSAASLFLRRSNLPPLSFAVLWRIFFLASLGCTAEICGNAGIKYSSPTLSAAMLNLVPAFTYILAVIFRMEEVNFGRFSTFAKALGTILSIFGAFIVTFYKGQSILITPPSSLTPPNLLLPQNWAFGAFLLACASLAVASIGIFLVSILKMYPTEMIVVAFYCLFVTIQSSLITLISERDVNAWRLDSKIGIIAVFFSGIVNLAYRVCVTAWCISRKGPLFVSLFKPLTVVVSVVIGVIFMKEDLYLGSLVGALVLIVGFYGVIWGKSKEEKIYKEIESSSYQDPLLQADTEET